MFNYLRRLGFFPFVFALLSAVASYAATNTQTIGTVDAQNISSATADFTGASLDVGGASTLGSTAVNNITINYNGNLTNGLQTSGTVDMKNNTLTLGTGDKQVTGDNSAAKLTINNGTSASNADLTLFDLALKNNTVTVNSRISNSSGNIFGAMLESNESGVGNANVTGNSISLGSGAQIAGGSPSLTGGAMQINTTRLDISSNAVVSSNVVSVAANTNNTISSDITGGTFVFNVDETGTHKTYNLNATLSGNQVNLSGGTFSGNITGARAVTATTAEYNTLNLAGNVQNNEINISGGKYEGNVFVGGSVSLEGAGLGSGSANAIDVTNNTITVTGGQFTDTIFVGGATTRDMQYTQEPAGTISGNTIEISGTPTFQGGLYLFGGYTTGTNTIFGNTLSLKTGGVKTYGVDYFDTYKFDLTGAAAGDVYLSSTGGNGHNNFYFAQYENYVSNSAINLDGVTFTWRDSALAEDGRPAALGIGQSVTLLTETSGMGLTGTIANNGAQEDITAGGNTYSYKVLQVGNKVELFHNGLTASGGWTENISISAGSNAGEDVFMHVDSGTITASSISATSTAAANATLTAQTLDVSQDTTLNLNGTTGDKVKFNTITVADGKTLTKNGNGFYGFNNMTITGSGVVNSLDAMAGGAANVTAGTATTFDQINVGAGSTLAITGTYGFNTLGVYGDGNTLTGNLAGAGKDLNFYLADTTAAGATALNVSGTADITDSNVHVGITGSSSPLEKEDQVVLLQASTLTGAPASETGVGMQGLFLTYDFDLETVGNQLVATVTKTGLTQESKAFSEGRATATALVNQGSDFAAQTGIASAANAALNQNSLAVFTAFGGGNSRLQTGSYVDLNSTNAMVGLSREVSIFKADFVVGSFVEYGHGNYHSYNNFGSGTVKGFGQSKYTGIGALSRWYGQDGSYVEGVLHAGVTDTDFNGAVFFAGQNARYDFDSWYYGGHLGVGRVWSLFDEFEDDVDEPDAVQFDGSLKFFLNHHEGKDVRISSGDEITFHEANSKRLRAALTARFFASRKWRPYIGAAYEHEFDGAAKASTYNMRIEAPTLKGNTGVGEAGLAYVGRGFTLGLGAEGYIGARKGWSGNVKLGFTF